MSPTRSRHIVFAGLAVVVVGCMLFGSGGEVKISDDTQQMYDYLESLEPGSILIVSFDHEASSLPEIRPLALCMLRHAFKNDVKLIGIALLAEGTGIGYRLMNTTAEEYNKQYGSDYVYLGFKPQFIAAILSMGESIPATFPEDYLGQPYDSLDLLDSIVNYDDIAGVVSIADGSLTTHWIEYGQSRFGVRVSAFVSAAMVTTYDPYLSSGQLYGMVGGLRGAAEYEQLLGLGGSGSRGMLAQTGAHLYIILLVIIGNVIFFRSRERGDR